MIAHHRDTNTILQAYFQSRSDKNCIPAFKSIMERLRQRGHKVDHNIIENECSADFKRVINENWKATLKIILPDMHRRNIAKRAI